MIPMQPGSRWQWSRTNLEFTRTNLEITPTFLSFAPTFLSFAPHHLILTPDRSRYDTDNAQQPPICCSRRMRSSEPGARRRPSSVLTAQNEVRCLEAAATARMPTFGPVFSVAGGGIFGHFMYFYGISCWVDLN